MNATLPLSAWSWQQTETSFRVSSIAGAKVWHPSNADHSCLNEDSAAAGDSLNRIAASDEDDAWAWLALGKLQMEQGELDQARLAFQMAAELSPGNAQIFIELGLVHQQLNEKDTAEAIFNHALALEPDNTAAMNLLGAFLMANDRHLEARVYFANVLAHQPDNLEVLLQLGDCCLKVGNFDVARVCCRRVIQLSPGHRLAAEQLAAVNMATSSGRNE